MILRFTAMFMVLISFIVATAFLGKDSTYVLGASGFSLLVAATCFYFTLRNVIRPLQRISERVERIAGGDLNVDLSDSYQLELSRLRDAVSGLTLTMKERIGFADSLLKGLLMPFAAVDASENITWMNQEMLKFVEAPGKPEDYYGQNFTRFFYGEARESNTSRALKERKTLFLKGEVTGRAGTHHWISVASFPIFDLDGKLLGAFTSIMDFTRIKEKEDHILAQNEHIKAIGDQAEVIAEQVARAADGLSAELGVANEGAERQMRLASEVATAMEQMNASVLEVARAAGNASELAGKTHDRAREGAVLVERVAERIDAVRGQAESLNRNMGELGTHADGIGRIMGVINDIADQTNLLALNAAIEAARAGDAGRGFAVVADEVRKLAEKTMGATRDVEGFVRSIQESAKTNIEAAALTGTAIAESASLARDSGQALTQILALSEQTADQVRSIATAAEEQSAASEQITRSTTEVNAISEGTSRSMRASARQVTELAESSHRLEAVIESIRKG